MPGALLGVGTVSVPTPSSSPSHRQTLRSRNSCSPQPFSCSSASECSSDSSSSALMVAREAKEREAIILGPSSEHVVGFLATARHLACNLEPLRNQNLFIAVLPATKDYYKNLLIQDV